MGKIKDLKGKILSNGTEVLEFVEIRNHSAYWKCKCFCGKTFVARGADLNNGHTSSCGCQIKIRASKMGKMNQHKIKDLTNQRFGKLIVLKDTGKRDSCRSVIWLCKCDCGMLKEISSHSLQRGTFSCGCVKSKGELKIAQLLLENGIPFSSQKTFEDCRFPDTNMLAKFDFYIDNKYIIEFDGIQHFDSRYGWNTEDNFKLIQKRDKIKDEYCKQHNIPLLRIPYTKLKDLTINDLLINDIEINQ